MSTIIVGIEYLIGAVLLGYLLYWHFRVGMTRFFDVDEFTHLHWAANIARGQKPYIDFFTFFTPGFYFLLTPLFWFFGKTIQLFTMARFFSFLVFAGIVGMTGLLYKTVRSKRFFLLPMIILAFLPMPFDKFMEVRPDNVSVLFGLIAIWLQIMATEHANSLKKGKFWFWSGVSYAVSMVILVKSLPFVVVGGFCYLLDAGVFEWIQLSLTKKKFLPFSLSPAHRQFIYGLSLVGGGFLIWLFSLGDISRAWYSLTKMPFEANTIGRIYIMEPHLFFFPNASFYGGWGITNALLLNHGFWVLGIFSGVIALFTPFIRANGNSKRAISETLLSGVFIVSVVLYVMFFPLKHSQYLIPIAVFIAIYSADVLAVVLRKLSFGSPLVLLGVALVLAKQTSIVNFPKISMNNTVQMQQIEQLRTIVQGSEQILDLDGRFIYTRDPYDICCLPFGTFVRFLSRPPAPLREVLEAKKVAYIYQGDSGRLWELWSDIAYIQEMYERVPGWGDALWKRKAL